MHDSLSNYDTACSYSTKFKKCLCVCVCAHYFTISGSHDWSDLSSVVIICLADQNVLPLGAIWFRRAWLNKNFIGPEAEWWLQQQVLSIKLIILLTVVYVFEWIHENKHNSGTCCSIYVHTLFLYF